LKRLFIGIALSEEVRLRLTEVQNGLREVATRQGVRFVREDKLHLTLVFLDTRPDEAVEELDRLGMEICADASPFELTLSGLGAFPSFRRPKVLWVGVEGQTDALVQLQAKFSAASMPGEAESYLPHITLARVVPGSPQVGRSVLPLAEALAGKPIGTWEVGEILLYESTPDGRYEVLRTWPLFGG